MEKRKIIILTIVSTIISLVVIILSYFGFTRYLSLHLTSSRGFIEKYSKLPTTGSKRVIISFSTTPDKIKKIRPMINSILDQTVKVDQIAMVIPYKYKGKKYDVPEYISQVANIFPSGKDYGKGTKLIPVLLREDECDTIIIALDDNVVYGQDFIYTLIEESQKNPDSIIIDKKGSAMLVKPDCFDYDVINREKEKFDNSWFLNKAKNSQTLDYCENYNIIGF